MSDNEEIDICPFKYEDRALTNNSITGEPEMTSFSYSACKLMWVSPFGQSECRKKMNGGNECIGESICPIMKKNTCGK